MGSDGWPGAPAAGEATNWGLGENTRAVHLPPAPCSRSSAVRRGSAGITRPRRRSPPRPRPWRAAASRSRPWPRPSLPGWPPASTPGRCGFPSAWNTARTLSPTLTWRWTRLALADQEPGPEGRGSMNQGRKIRVAVVFGGQSPEHAISCAGGGAMLAAIDRDRYDVIPVGILPDGRWVLTADEPERLAIAGGEMPSVESVAD